MSNTFPMNPLTLAGLPSSSNRSNTPPTSMAAAGQQQQQSSPNSFLQGLSSRLRSQQQQQQQQQSSSSQNLPSSVSSSAALSSSGGYQNNNFGSLSGGGQSSFGSSSSGGVGGRSVMDIFDSANIPGPASTFGFSSSSAPSNLRGHHNNNNSNNFGIPPGPPSTFDINEFPSLSGGGTNSGLGGGSILPSSAPGSNRPNYVGQLVKDVHPGQGLGSSVADYKPQPTFDMNEYDFPALPGSGAPGSEAARAAAVAAALRNSNNENSGSIGSNLGVGSGGGGGQTMMGYGSDISGLGSDIGSVHRHHRQFDTSMDGGRAGLGNAHLPPSNMANVTKSGKKGIVTTKEGKVSNIPMGMVTDQFGMIGLLTFIRAAETEQNIVSLALGTDLTSLKLDLNSSDTLYSTFPGPWSESPLKPHEIDYPVPSEYLIYHQVRDKLAPIREKLARYGDDTLFFLFYMFPNDLLQIGAANELFNRDWRYHKDDKVWVTRAPGMPPVEKTTTYERGTYYFFDPTLWRRVAKEFLLDYDRLENKPASVYLQSSAAAAAAAAGQQHLTNNSSAGGGNSGSGIGSSNSVVVGGSSSGSSAVGNLMSA